MTEKPILFKGDMVRRILSGDKTQTRRIVKPQPTKCGSKDRDEWIWKGGKELLDCSYGAHYVHTNWSHVLKAMQAVARRRVGHKLWVRETWQSAAAMNVCHAADDYAVYRATDPDWETTEEWKWRPAIHMPRWASRITLEITDIRVQRVQEISAEDAIAEGIDYDKHKCGCEVCSRTSVICPASSSSLVMAYAELWESINGKDSWKANNWVFAITFRKL